MVGMAELWLACKVLVRRNSTPETPQMAAGELSDLLRGSRVAVLGLTASMSTNLDLVTIGGRRVPSASCRQDLR